MAKIIPHPSTDHKAVESSWLLAYSILWQHSRLSHKEVTDARYSLKEAMYTMPMPDRRRSFIMICERLLLTYRMVQKDPARWIDLPSIWFHPGYENGFTDTLSMYQQIALKRLEIRNYQQGLRVFATAYWKYTIDPSDEHLVKCSRKLLQLREYDLLQLWNNVIMLCITSK
ncbi:hypothetical protein ACE38W_00865 [Chitinophaga sp. Hz27]|uniref:hypothetical protein n=1 Tax=Chitinophaga sp. Hz27 TaxID=3347169 RepID=UPI0035DE1049